MAGFLYHLPGLTRDKLAPGGVFSRSLLAARGLAEILSDVTNCPDHATVANVDRQGPDGGPGCIVAANPPRTMGYYPRQQEWQQVDGVDGCWLGYDKGEFPKPEDLERPATIAGYGPTLGDGNAWTIPILRRPDDTTELPRDLIGKANGTVEMPVSRRYRKLWEDSVDDVAFCFDESGKVREAMAVDLEKMFDVLAKCIRILAVNYRVGMAEVNALQLIDSTNWYGVIASSVDVPQYMAIEESLKKTNDSSGAAALNSTPGEQDSSPAIAPVVAS